MEDVTGSVEVKLFKEVLIDGAKLVVIASMVEKDQWQLSVQNEYGINSTWLELFPGAQLAIDVGVNAIEKEGIDTFINTEGFEYLAEQNV